MYKLVRSEWYSALHEFFKRLENSLGENLVSVIGLDEDSYVYDSNALVVVKEVNEEVRRAVARAALDVNEKHECTISYYLTSDQDKVVIDEFRKVASSSKRS